MLRWYANLKIAGKLACNFGICLVLAAAVGISNLGRMAQLNTRNAHAHERTLKGISAIATIRYHLMQHHETEILSSASAENGRTAEIEHQLETQEAQLATDFKSYEALTAQPEDQANFQKLQTAWTDYREGEPALGTTGSEKKSVSAENEPRSTARQQKFDIVLASVSEIFDWNAHQGDSVAQETEVAYVNARNVSLLLVFGNMLVCVVLGSLLEFSLCRPLKQISERMESLQSHCMTELGQATDGMAHGDLTLHVNPTTQPVSIDRQDEIGKLAQTFNRMLERTQKTIESFHKAQCALKQLIGEVKTSAEGVAETSHMLAQAAAANRESTSHIAANVEGVAQAAEQTATTSQEMARGSEQQAHTAEQAAGATSRLQYSVSQVQSGAQRQQEATGQAESGMREAAAAVEEVAHSAQQMAGSAQQAASVAETGGTAVAQTLASIGRIRTQVETSAEKVRELGRKGQEIGAIVETIDQIAEQTNLLALNAAIEAARAGEHGRGFAVVADEVRKLAERATGATKEIATLIGSVRADVEEAVQAMENSSREVTAGVARSEEASNALQHILQAAQTVADEVQGVTATAQEMSASVQQVLETVASVRQVSIENEQTMLEMAAGTEQVASAITTVASISEEAAAGAEEMNACAQEVSSSANQVALVVREQKQSVEQVNTAASELNGMASRLKELVTQFQLEEAEKGEEAPVLRMAA